MRAASAVRASGPPPAEAGDLVAQLESLVDGPVAVLRLGARGEEAVEPLRQYLLESRITSLFQPRCWAVEALAALGARDVLLEYLRRARSVSDPVLRLSEDAVESAAARALAAWPSDEVFTSLLDRARARLLPGLVEALGSFRRAEATPIFIHALGDGLCRLAAEKGLRALGRAALAPLIRAALSPRPEARDESPSSLQRRCSAATLLAEGEPEPVDWPALRPLLLESDPGLVVAAARLAVKIGPPDDRRLAAARLLFLSAAAPWPLSVDVEDCLVDLCPEASDLVGEEIGRRSTSPVPRQAFDVGLALLRRVLHKARKS